MPLINLIILHYLKLNNVYADQLYIGPIVTSVKVICRKKYTEHTLCIGDDSY